MADARSPSTTTATSSTWTTVATCVISLIAQTFSTPTFSTPIYNKVTGTYFVNVTAPAYQQGMNKLEILLPENLTLGHTSLATHLILTLPVEAKGTETRSYGSSTALIKQHAWINNRSIAVATPSFAITPWFGNHPANNTSPHTSASVPVLQESFVVNVIVPYLLSGTLPIASTASIYLMGFSKSGWGAFTLLMRNEHTFKQAALWDSPTMLTKAYCEWLMHQHPADLWGMMQVFGDCATWETYSPVEIVSQNRVPQSFLNQTHPRIWLGGHHYFGNWPLSTHTSTLPPGAPFNHTHDFHQLLTSYNVAHTYNDSLDPGKHEWSWKWMLPALESFAI